MPAFTYSAYGLTITSSFEIPELVEVDEIDGNPDVEIDMADFPDRIEGATERSEIHEVRVGQLLLRIEDVGRYLVSDGSRVLVDRHPSASDHDVRVYLLGTCFGALLHQRGALVLHASGMGTEVGAVLFTGDSGAGKSTTLAELMRRGHRMLVDDVCAITLDENGAPIVTPSYPRTRLWSDAASRLDVETAGLQRTRDFMDKYERQLPGQFWREVGPIRRIFHLAGSRGDELSVSPVPPMQAIPTILANTYRAVLLDGLGVRNQHFQIASAVARDVPLRRVVRPATTFQLEELADMILADLDLS